MEKSTLGEEPREGAEPAEAPSAAAYRANTRILDPGLFADIAPPVAGDPAPAPPPRAPPAPCEPKPLCSETAETPASAPAPRPAPRSLRRAPVLFVGAAILAVLSFAIVKVQHGDPPAPAAAPSGLDPTSAKTAPPPEVSSASPGSEPAPASGAPAAGSGAGPSTETPSTTAPAAAPMAPPRAASKTSGTAAASPAPASAPASARPATTGGLVFPSD